MVTVRINNYRLEDIDLFVFDKDGTLIDLVNYWQQMIGFRAEHLCRHYGLCLNTHKAALMFEMGVDVERSRLRPEGPVGLLPREVVQKAAEDYLLRYNCKDVSNICFNIFKQVDRLSLSCLDRLIKPIEGAVELLKSIKAKSGKIAIATTDKTERAQLVVDFMEIDGLCDMIVGADKVTNSKPAPDMLELITQTLGVLPCNSIMVGDAITDIQMGINAKFASSIAVCTGLTDKENLAGLTRYVVDDVSQIYID